ncbi:MAG: YceI family protein [Rhizomicrobium sp.]|jgi:polyisoprenoid-binding protein YceI
MQCIAKILSVALLSLVIGPAFAASIAPKGAYTLDPQHTQILFAIKHMGISTFYGRLGKASGTIDFDQAAPEKSALRVEIDTSTIDTHVPELDSSVPNSLFQADKFPTAGFVSTAIAKTGDNTGTVTGNLTIAGVTKPVTLAVTFNGGRGTGEPLQPYRIGFDATATIKRSDFGLTHVIWTGFVSDEVTLLIEAEAERK